MASILLQSGSDDLGSGVAKKELVVPTVTSGEVKIDGPDPLEHYWPPLDPHPDLP